MAGYLGASPVPQTIQKKQSFTATASQTTFTTTGYTDGAFINVYLNGVRLINGTDYQATNGSDIVLTTGASASDVLDFETFNEFTLVDQTLETPTFRTSATLKNDTHEDTDGGRESTLIFKGEQSGGEISTLAQIQASHDGTADDQKGDLIFKTNDGSDNNAPTEAARIDSGQNLLVGKTSTSSGATVDGIIAFNDGRIFATTSVTTASEAPLLSARTTSAGDGKFVDMRYNGSSLGSISSRGGVATNLILRTATGQGAGIGGANSGVLPCDEDGLQDNEINLGASGTRWNDLYLSGGAYLGGTTSANRLEDYEEGTWTPVLTGITVASGTLDGTYRKIGGLVSLTMRLENATLTGTHTGSKIEGLPFACSLRTSSSGPVLYNHANGDKPVGILIEGGTSLAYFQYNSTAQWVGAPFTAGSNRYLAVQLTYNTNA
jgi:hypothetical protein